MMLKFISVFTIVAIVLVAPSLAQSPGDIVGYTWYDYQSNGSPGNRLAVYDDGSVYLCWTHTASWPYPPAARHA
jgi:hypothetical protein